MESLIAADKIRLSYYFQPVSDIRTGVTKINSKT